MTITRRFREGIDPTSVVVIVATIAALVVRFVALGARVAHWDEARVAYWILQAMESGSFEYRPIIHGPFLQHVNRYLFAALGPTDAVMRAPVALLGGLLPLAALLFRTRLTDHETAALAVLLAFDPTLLYYSRFLRSDVPVAGFAFVALGFILRTVDTDRVRWLVPAAFAIGFAAATKENVVVYLVCWAGALLLLLDHRLLLASVGADPAGRSLRGVLRGVSTTVRYALVRAGPAIPVVLVIFLATTVWAYAPRSANPGAVALGNALSDPGIWPPLFRESTIGAGEKLFDTWVDPRGSTREFGYPVYLGALVKDLALASGPVALLGLAGSLVDRYGGMPRDLPAFALFWFLLSMVAYPAVTDVPAPWLVVHLVVPLAIPAAVALAATYEYGHTAFTTGNRTGTSRAVLILLAVSVSVAGIGAFTAFAAPTSPDNELVQYAQPAGDLRETAYDIDRLGADSSSMDVLFFGSTLVDDGGSQVPRQPGCVAWFAALPLPWYTERADAGVVCAANDTALPETLPPVVIVDTADVNATLRRRTAGYERRVHRLRTTDSRTVVFVDDDRVPPAADASKPER